jgi:hypothetical protein
VQLALARSLSLSVGFGMFDLSVIHEIKEGSNKLNEKEQIYPDQKY